MEWLQIAGFLVAGLTVLALGAEILVRGATHLGRRLGMDELLIGLTLVAFGTSMPELVVSLGGALRGSAEIAVGNAVGSNAFNGLVILGLCGLLRPLEVASSTVWKEIPFSLLALFTLGALANDLGLSGAGPDLVSRGDGLVLLAFFGVFLAYLLAVYRAAPPAPPASDAPPPVSLPRAALLVLTGLALLILGGNWTVAGALRTARLLGVSDGLIAVTVLAGGTSLPELATSLVATLRGRIDVAVGNVVGSNIFNVFFILGTTATVRDLPYPGGSNLDLAAAGLAGLVLFGAMFTGQRRRLDRWEAALLLVGYGVYGFLRYGLEGG